MKRGSRLVMFVLLLGADPFACARHTTLEGDASSTNASSRGGADDSEQVQDALAPMGVGGRGAGESRCFADIDGSSAPSVLALGPNNHVFQPAHVRAGAVSNYQGARVFEGPVLGLTANFTGYEALEADPSAFGARSRYAASLENGQRTSLLEYLEYTGEVRLMPDGCEGALLAGRRVRVELLWKLDGAIAESFPQGVVLGGAAPPGALLTFPSYVISTGDDAHRLLNGLQPTLLEYAFPPHDGSTAGPVYLRLWALSRWGVPSTLYINRVDWD